MNFLSLLLGGAPQPHSERFHFLGPRKYKDDFLTHHQEHIQPLVGHIEVSRLEALESLRKRGRIAVTASAVVALFAIYLMTAVIQDPIVIFVAGFICVGLFGWAHLPVKNYKTNIKNSIFPKIFKFFGDDFKFYEHSSWSVHSLKNSKILPSFDECKTEDFVSGTYKEVALKLMEAQLINVSRDSKGRTRRTTVFKGIFILFGMNKSFDAQTIVKRDKGAIGNWFGDKFSRLETVSLEDPVFEKQFQVYSGNQIEARYLLTTSFMERLLSINDIFGGNNIQCSFYDNQVLIMIASKQNRFEPGSIYKPATLEREVATLLSEMDEIFHIVETLKLDQKTGL